MTNIDELKMICRENDVPFFTDEELQYYLDKNASDVKSAAYQCLLVKAEDTTLSVSGMSTADTSKYFRRLAAMNRPSHSGILKGGE